MLYNNFYFTLKFKKIKYFHKTNFRNVEWNF